MRLLVATTNAGKLREIREALAGVPLEIVTLADLDDEWPTPEETGRTFAENARLKARYYANVTRCVTVAEDSGLEIDALEGRPGVLSARYPGATYEERFQNLYGELAARGLSGSTARFVCALALALPAAARKQPPAEPSVGGGQRAPDESAAAEIVFEARGVVEGAIAPEPRGAGGFGYDPIFYYPPYGRTLAEVSADDKLRVSHRGAAFRQLEAFLRARESAAR
jgi:XTP/dITP diphosphohydrolase